jgi:hypothetical protein
MKTFKAKRAALLFTVMTLVTPLLYAQRGVDDYMDEDDVREFERHAHLNLSTFEWVSILVGVGLLFAAKSIRDKNTGASNVLGCLGILGALPLVLVILAVAQKAVTYGIILALIIGGLYLLFGRKS